MARVWFLICIVGNVTLSLPVNITGHSRRHSPTRLDLSPSPAAQTIPGESCVDQTLSIVSMFELHVQRGRKVQNKQQQQQQQQQQQ